MSTIKSSDEHLTLNADGSSKDIKFQANGVEKASISSSGAFTSTTIDATKLTGDLPAISGANLTGVGVAGITSSADATAITIDSSENVGIGTTPETGWRSSAVGVDIGDGGAIAGYDGSSGAMQVLSNAYWHTSGGSGWKYKNSSYPATMLNTDGEFVFKTAGNGTADNAITWTTAMTIAAGGEITNSSGVYNTTPTSTTATGWNFDSSGATVTCTQNTAVKIGDCGTSGMLIINDTTLNGQINILLTGAGAFTFLGASSHWVNSSSPSTSQVGFYQSNNQIYVKNGKSSTVQLGLLTFRTRNAQ